MNTRSRSIARLLPATFTPALPSPSRPHAAAPPWAARRALALLGSLRRGSLRLQGPHGLVRRFGQAGSGPAAALVVHDWDVFADALRGGDVAFAEAHLDGRWQSPDLVALLRLVLANRDALERLVHGSWWGSLLKRLRHRLNRNTRRGSRRNIHAHYDLGNAFYRLWLDRSMNYSSALFAGDLRQPLEQAQAAKIERALREVGLQRGQRLLEVGCGWGDLAHTAASSFGASVLGLTLSREQLAHGQARLQAAGLADKAELRLQDWRDLDGAGGYDAIVSIEMFEAVGQAYWRRYFAMLARQLKPGGRACIQTITIRDELFERYQHSTDFIQQYIFPGGMLPSAAAFAAEAGRAGLVVERSLAFGADYAETLRRWRERFSAERPRVRELGFDERFERLWTFYLAYCEAAFAEGSTDVVQFTLRRPA